MKDEHFINKPNNLVPYTTFYMFWMNIFTIVTKLYKIQLLNSDCLLDDRFFKYNLNERG